MPASSRPRSVSRSTPAARTSARSPSPPTSPASRPTRSASSSCPAAPTPPRRVTPRPTSPRSRRPASSPPPCPSSASPPVSRRSARVTCPRLSTPTAPCVRPAPAPGTRELRRSVLGTPPRPRAPRNKRRAERETGVLRVLLFASLLQKGGALSVRGPDELLGPVWGTVTLGPGRRDYYCMITVWK